jgi:hypothetical protein
MKKNVLNILIITCFLTIVACSSSLRIETLKPESDDASPILYDNNPSYINMPIKINLKDIENKTNTLLTGLIYEDNTIEDDNYEIQIWKLAPISFENKNGKIKTIFPLKAFIKYRLGANKIGISLYNTREFKLNGNLTLLSVVNLSNWKIKTHTELESLDWNESPSINILGKAIPITYLINPTIPLFKSKIEKKIDETVSKSLDFKPNVMEALEKICTPFEMSSTYQSWLRIVPLELYTTDAKLDSENIYFEMGLKCTIESLVGQKPNSLFDKNKIVLKAISKVPDKISANIIAVSSYQDASKIISSNFSGKEFASGKRKVQIQNVTIWHKNGKMIIALEVSGSLNGKIYLSGFPEYNEQTKEIYFDKLEYVLDTKNRLIKTANWMAQSYFFKKIEANCRYSIKPNLDEGKQNILKYLKNYSPITGVYINGTIEDITFEKIQLTNKAILAFININGDINIKVDGSK